VIEYTGARVWEKGVRLYKTSKKPLHQPVKLQPTVHQDEHANRKEQQVQDVIALALLVSAI